jgi:hypothetical protein
MSYSLFSHFGPIAASSYFYNDSIPILYLKKRQYFQFDMIKKDIKTSCYYY